MRELVYVSRRKLLQFRGERTPRRLLQRINNIGIKAPMDLGEFSMALGSDTSQRNGEPVERVAEYLQQIARHHRDPRAQSGDWVHFDTKMNYATTSVQPGRPTPGEDGPLIFWESAPQLTQAEYMARLHFQPSRIADAARYRRWIGRRAVEQLCRRGPRTPSE